MADFEPKTTQDLFVCPICFEKLTDQIQFPNCLHTFCKSCLISYLSSTVVKTTEVTCPVCRRVCEIKQNESYQDWVEGLSRMDGSDIEDNRNCVSEEKANRCDVCSRQNLEAVGGFWCVDCSDMLCTKCRDIHKSIRSTMKHEVIAKSEISNLKMFKRNLYCEDHSDRKLEVYCFDHETPCCLMCATITHRKCDRVESLEECSKSVKTEDVDSLLNSFKILQKDCIAKEKLERTSHSELKSTCSQLANDIKVKAGKMIIHVQNKEQELLQDLSTVETYKSEEFEKKREMFQETRQAICKQIDSLTAVKSLSTVHMFLETNKCKKLYTSLKDGQAKWELPDEKCSVSLELDSFVVNFDAAFKTFGRCKLNKVNMREDNLEIISRISCQCDVRDLEIIDKSHIVFSSYSDCSVHLYNTDGLQKASLQLGGQLWAISRWGGKIAVVNIGDNSIEVLNVTLSPPSIALDSSIKLNYIPSGVAEKGEDLIVLCDTKMLQISKAGNISELFMTPSKCSYGFCCATRDALLYTDPNNSGQLYSVKNEGYFQNRFERTYPEVKNPVGVTTDSDGYMYLVGYSSSSLVQLDNDGTFLRTLIKNDCDVGNPYGVRIFEDLNSVKLLLATASASPKGRRKLNFVEKKEKLPLTGKSIFVDVKELSQSRLIKEDIQRLGARVDEFFHKEINYVITSNRTSRSDKHDPLQSPDSPSTVSTPSPFNTGPSPSPAAGNKPSQESVIRGKAIAKRAVTKETNPVLTNAENWGIKIVTLDVAQKWIQREISKLPQSNSKPKSNVNNVQGGCKVKKLKTPYLKLESVTRQYKVVYHQAEVWPHANVETPRGTCPFDGTSVGGEKSREERGDRIGLIPLEPRTPESKTGQGGSTKSQENSKSSNRKAPQKGQRTSIIGGVRIVTAGEIRRRKELKRLQEKRRGYCECCEVKYDDLTKHVREEQHKEFIREKKHYQDLDCLINSGPSQATFLKRVLEQCCQTAGGTRSNVEKSVKREEATPPSVQTSMKSTSSKTTLKIVNSEVKQRRRQSPRKVWQNASEHEQTKLLKDSIEQDIRQRKEIRRSAEIDLQLENHYVPTRTRNFLFVQGTSSQNSDRAGFKNDNQGEIGTNKLKDSSLINRKNEQCHSAVVKDSVTGSERSPKTTTCSTALQGSNKIKDQECKSNNRRSKDKQFQSPYNKDVESYKKTLKSPRKKSPQHRKSREEVDSVNVVYEKNSSQTVASERSARKSTAEKEQNSEECVLKRRLRSPKMATLPNKETSESTKAKGEKSKLGDCELKREGKEMVNQMKNDIKGSNSTESLKVDMDKTEADNFKEKGHAEHIKTRSRSADSQAKQEDKQELRNARSKRKPRKSKEKGTSSKKITVENDEQASDDIEIVSCDEDTSSNEQDVGNLCDVNNENASGLQGRVKNTVEPDNCNGEPSTSTVTVQNDECSTVEVNAVHEDDSPKKHRHLRSRKSLLTEHQDDTSECQIEKAKLIVHPHQTSKSPSVMNKMMAIKNANLAAPLSIKKIQSPNQKHSTAKNLQTCIDSKPEKENVGQSENVQETFEEEKVFDEQVEKSLFYIERVHRLRSTDQRQNCVDRELQDISVKVQERNSRPNSPVPGAWGRNNCVPASPVFKSSPRLAGLRTPNKRIVSSMQTTPVVSSPKSGLSNTPRSNKRKRWNKRRESKSDENSLNTPKVKRLEKLKYRTANGKNFEKVANVDNAVSRKEKIAGKNKIPTGAKNEIDSTTSQKIQNSKKEQSDTPPTVKETLQDNLKSPLKDEKIKSPLKRTSLEKKCVSPRRGSTPLVWRNAKGSTPKGRKKRIKLNKSWSVLSDRSVNKLLHESDSESNFEGFDEGDLTGQSSLCSDASFVEINEVEFEENSDQEWELEEENVEGRMKDDDEGGVFPEIFSSPGKRSDSSWDTGFVDFIDTQLSNKKKSPKKNATLLSAEAASLCSPRRRQRLESIPEGSTENQLQRVRKRRKVEEKEEEFQSFMVSDVSAQVDEDIQFNFSSPNKRKSKVMKNKSDEPKRGKSLDYGLPVKEVRLTGCLLRRQMLKMAKSKTLRSSERKESLTNSDCEIECSNVSGQKTKHKRDRENKCFDDDSMPNLSPQGNKRIAKNSKSFGGRSSDIPNLSPHIQRHSFPVVNNRRSGRT